MSSFLFLLFILPTVHIHKRRNSVFENVFTESENHFQRLSAVPIATHHFSINLETFHFKFQANLLKAAHRLTIKFLLKIDFAFQSPLLRLVPTP